METDGEADGPVALVIELGGAVPAGLAAVLAEFPDELVSIEAKNFDAAAYTLQLVCLLTSGGALTALTSLVRAHIESKQHVVIKADGIEVQGVSAKKAVQTLERLRESLPVSER